MTRVTIVSSTCEIDRTLKMGENEGANGLDGRGIRTSWGCQSLTIKSCREKLRLDVCEQAKSVLRCVKKKADCLNHCTMRVHKHQSWLFCELQNNAQS